MITRRAVGAVGSGAVDEESGDLGSPPRTHGSESEGKYHKGDKPIVSKRRGNKYMRLSTGGNGSRSIAFGGDEEGRSALSKARRRVITAVLLTVVIIAYYMGATGAIWAGLRVLWVEKVVMADIPTDESLGLLENESCANPLFRKVPLLQTMGRTEVKSDNKLVDPETGYLGPFKGQPYVWLSWETNCATWMDDGPEDGLAQIVEAGMKFPLAGNNRVMSTVTWNVVSAPEEKWSRPASSTNAWKGGWVHRTLIGPFHPGDEVEYTVQVGDLTYGPVKFLHMGEAPLRARNQAPYRFLVLGDNQYAAWEFRRVLWAMWHYLGGFSKINQVIHTGDSVQYRLNPVAWESQLWHPLDEFGIAGKIPVTFVHGNHDNVGTGGIYMSPLRWFSYDVGCTRFIILDSNMDPRYGGAIGAAGADQAAWLDRELKRDDFKAARVKIVVMHIPPYIEYWEKKTWEEGEKEWGAWITDWTERFKQAGVTMVISGHSHMYQRGSKGPEDPIYIINGGAGGSLEKPDEKVAYHHMYTRSVFKNSMAMLNIYGGLDANDPVRVEWKAISDRGKAIDAFVLSQPKAGQPFKRTGVWTTN